jgi:hypothetical protein
MIAATALTVNFPLFAPGRPNCTFLSEGIEIVEGVSNILLATFCKGFRFLAGFVGGLAFLCFSMPTRERFFIFL